MEDSEKEKRIIEVV
jgi:hypothetical protein